MYICFVTLTSLFYTGHANSHWSQPARINVKVIVSYSKQTDWQIDTSAFFFNFSICDPFREELYYIYIDYKFIISTRTLFILKYESIWIWTLNVNFNSIFFLTDHKRRPRHRVVLLVKRIWTGNTFFSLFYSLGFTLSWFIMTRANPLKFKYQVLVFPVKYILPDTLSRWLYSLWEIQITI